MKGFNYLFVLLFFSTHLFSTNYTFTGELDTDWINPDNWDVYPGTFLAEGDTVFINAMCTQATGDYEIYGDIIISVDATMSSCSYMDVFGKITNYGNLMSDGIVNIHEIGSLVNEGTLGGFGYYVLGQLINNGEALELALADSEGDIINNGTMGCDYVFGFGLFHNTESGILLGENAFDNHGIFINDGTATNIWIENYGEIINNGELQNIDVISHEGTITNNNLINANFFELFYGSEFINTGAIQLSELLASWEDTGISNSGSITTNNFINHGVFHNTGEITLEGFAQNGDLDFPLVEASYILNDGTIYNLGDFSNNDTIFNNLDLINEGSIGGTGVIIGNVIIDGTLAPGNSPGIFNVVGDYEQTASADLVIELDGPATGTPGVDFDQVIISGQAILDGTLTVVLNTSEPNIGDEYPIMLYGSLEPGTSVTLIAPILSGNKVWVLQYVDNVGLILTVDADLPVDMTKFTIERQSSNVLLQWTTESEINNSGFEVLRSDDANTWQSIGFVVGKGTTLEQNEYNYIDSEAPAGKLYYRLKQIDDDGRFKLSQVLSIHLEPQLRFFPNPAINTITVSTAGDKPYQILNQQGVLIMQGIVSDKQELDVSHLIEGNYILLIGTETFQFRKQN